MWFLKRLNYLPQTDMCPNGHIGRYLGVSISRTAMQISFKRYNDEVHNVKCKMN